MTRATTPTAAEIAAVIPAYNVAPQIERVIRSIPASVRHVIVVDDASDDETAAIVGRLLDGRVELIRHRTNQGVGGAMLSGYSRALQRGAEVVVKIDGDGQMDAGRLPALLAPLLAAEADYAKGNRFLHPAELQQMPGLRRAGNLGLTFLTKAASGYWPIFDPTNGYTAIHASVLRLIDPECIAQGYFFESSLLLELRRLRAVVVDVPMPSVYRDEKSSLSPTKALVTFPLHLGSGFVRRILREYFLYNFSAGSALIVAALPLLLFGLIWGSVHWYLSIKTGQLATTGTVLLAVLPIILGVQCLLQALVLDIGSVPRQSLAGRLRDHDLAAVRHGAMEAYFDRSLLVAPSTPSEAGARSGHS